VQRCHGEKPKNFHLGITFAGFRSTLVFSGTEQQKVEQLAAALSFDWRVSERVTLVVGAGAVPFASVGGVEGPGGVVSLGVSLLALEQGQYTPFIMGAFSLSASRLALTKNVIVPAGEALGVPNPMTAVDGRLALTIGYTFWERFTPYIVGRVFGGPVFYGSKTGTDLYHYQVGAGFVVGLPLGFDVSGEIIPLGEQRFSVSIGYSF
jgi:hypothetical protein